MKTKIATAAAALIAAAAFAQDAAGAAAMEERSDLGRWYAGLGAGYADFEGDDALEDGAYAVLRAGYDYDAHWSLEASLSIAPALDENVGGAKYKDADGVWREHAAGYPYAARHGGESGFGDAWMARLYAEALFHLTRFEAFSPFLAFGAGAALYEEDVTGGGRLSPGLRAGGGFMWHLSDSWSLRADWRVGVSGRGTEFDQMAGIGFIYRFAAPRAVAD